jgi:hypothetical protein
LPGRVHGLRGEQITAFGLSARMRLDLVVHQMVVQGLAG